MSPILFRLLESEAGSDLAEAFVDEAFSALGDRLQLVGLLRPVEWNDWYKYRTMFHLTIVDKARRSHVAGNLKIARQGMLPGRAPGVRPELAEIFQELDSDWFSLGQDENYYETLNSLPGQMGEAVLRSLRDIALDVDRLAELSSEDVLGESLLRSVAIERVQDRFAPLARGEASHSTFEFSYHSSDLFSGFDDFDMNFHVTPGSWPPTNVHCVIGRNGVGKTHLLRGIVKAASEPDSTLSMFVAGGERTGVARFAAIVLVSFSAFDPFEPPAPPQLQRVRSRYIGLQRIADSKNDSVEDPQDVATKSTENLRDEFVEMAHRCREGVRSERWQQALDALGSDPIFAAADVTRLVRCELENMANEARTLFSSLSTGHKIVLLTITSLVALVEERTLVLFDEPEAHLHPPLISSYTRCISRLMAERNGVAILATHSPVVVQEVPRESVQVISRFGATTTVSRPEFETFGESTARLTAEVFGLEVRRSGFYALLREAKGRFSTYEAALASFEGKLGGEARALLRGMYTDGTGS